MNEQPQTLLEVIRFFEDEQRAFESVRDRRWPNGVSCPRCGSASVRFMESRRAWNCNDCRRQFTAKTGTIFAESPISFSKWLPAMWLIANCKNGISSYELARDLGVTQKTAWFMLQRIRLAMQDDRIDKLGGEVEVDETYIGGKARNMHYGAKRTKNVHGGGVGKAVVMGFLERGGKVQTKVIGSTDRKTMRREIFKRVDESAKLFTDGHSGLRKHGVLLPASGR